MTTTDNMNSIYSFLKSKGMSDTAIAGVMGNIKQESSFNPKAVNSSSGAFGIAQWLGSRKTALQKYASQTGGSVDSLTTQENYLWKEISSGSYGNVSQLNKMSPSQAAVYFEQNFEKAGSGAVLTTRENNASSIYSQISNGDISSSGFSGSSSTDSSSGGLIDTSLGVPTISNIGKLMSQGLGILVGAGIIFMGIYITMNPLSDLSSAIYSLKK